MKRNRNKELSFQPPIYAMLSDLTSFYFLSYGGIVFRRMARINILQETRTEFVKGMVEGMYYSYCLGLQFTTLISNSSVRPTVFSPAEWVY